MLNLLHSQWSKEVKHHKDFEYLKDYYSNIFENIYHKSAINNKKHDFMISPSYNYSIPNEKPNILIQNTALPAQNKIESESIKTKKASKTLDKVQFSSIYNNK